MLKIFWRRCRRVVLCLTGALALGACVAVPGKPVSSAPVQKDGVVKQLVLTHDTEVSVSTFYSRTLRGQTHWKYVASLPEGDIYRPVDTVLTVESGNVHEAYIVVHDRELVGYYLPVEANFVTLAPVVALDFNTIN